MKVLLVYPNLPLQYSLPHSISTLAGCLKERHHMVSLFDTTYYHTMLSDDERRVQRGQVEPFEMKYVKTTDMYKDFNLLVNRLMPDVIMITFVDNTAELGLSLLRSLKKHVFTVAGGVSCILNPGRFHVPEIDMVYTGTAEEFTRCAYAMEDFSVFEPERLFRPMGGQWRKTIPFVFDRGCPFNCGFCCAPALREQFGYHRKTIKQIREELRFQITKHSPEFLYFSSETFLAMPMLTLETLAKIYTQYNLPFWCQTHVDTITKRRAEILRSMNCWRVSIGIECGNEYYRRLMIGKQFSNKDAVHAFRLLKEQNISAAANNIIGLPFETEEMVKETIRLNQVLYSIMPEMQLNCYIFQPYYGTKLRKLCEEKHILLDKGLGTVQGEPVIHNPFMSNEKIVWYRDNFHELVTNGGTI